MRIGGVLALALALACGARADDFEVVFTTDEPLGLLLSRTLLVMGFAKGEAGPLPAEASGWIRDGDALLAVNAEAVAGAAVDAVGVRIRNADLPKVLRFRARNGENRTAEMGMLRNSHARIDAYMGALDMVRDNRAVGSARFVKALFGGPLSCRRAPLIAARPAHGSRSTRTRRPRPTRSCSSSAACARSPTRRSWRSRCRPWAWSSPTRSAPPSACRAKRTTRRRSRCPS
jgi:hypothetical protein